VLETASSHPKREITSFFLNLAIHALQDLSKFSFSVKDLTGNENRKDSKFT